MVPSTRLKRGLLVVAVLAAVVLLTAWVLWPEPAIGPANYRRIQLGMTQPEIEVTIGLPPSHRYGNRLNLASESYGHMAEKGRYPGEFNRPSVEWRGSRYAIVVYFDDGRATFCGLFKLGASMKPPGLLPRIRSWLGW